MTQLKIDILYNILLGSFLTACLTFFIDFCIDHPRRIFGEYKVWLSAKILNRYIKGWKFRILRRYAMPLQYNEGLSVIIKSKWAKEDKYNAYTKIKETIIEAAAPLAFWEKPMGLCRYCMNPYLCFITIWLTEIPNLICLHPYLFWMVIAYPVASNFFLHKMN